MSPVPYFNTSRTSDRWLAWTSLLLKSRLYCQRKNCAKHLVDFPRTEYNKPYIPPQYISFSVSHQWPFVGLVYDPDGTRKVGFDIVVFDPPNEKLYQSTLEFVQVFQDQFAPCEWTAIMETYSAQGNDALLREFYLRWAVKEAYTKALGLGMYVDFSSFATQFHTNEEDTGGLWQRLHRQEAGTSVSLVGRIDHEGDGVAFKCRNPSLWHFVFVRLLDQVNDNCCLGYGCVCAETIEEECAVEIQRASSVDFLIEDLEAPEFNH